MNDDESIGGKAYKALMKNWNPKNIPLRLEKKETKKYGWVSEQAKAMGIKGLLYKTPDGTRVKILKYTDSPDNHGTNGWTDLVCIGEVTTQLRTSLS